MTSKEIIDEARGLYPSRLMINGGSLDSIEHYDESVWSTTSTWPSTTSGMLYTNWDSFKSNFQQENSGESDVRDDNKR